MYFVLVLFVIDLLLFILLTIYSSILIKIQGIFENEVFNLNKDYFYKVKSIRSLTYWVFDCNVTLRDGIEWGKYLNFIMITFF